jgi:hypothetical protein
MGSRVLINGTWYKTYPHFLSAVVLQQVQINTGLMLERAIIDGQQRLTTLQLLLDALHGEPSTAHPGAGATRKRFQEQLATKDAEIAREKAAFGTYGTIT